MAGPDVFDKTGGPVPTGSSSPLRACAAGVRRVSPGEEISLSGAPGTKAALLVSGTSFAFAALPDGRRQIVAVQFPGDALGLASPGAGAVRLQYEAVTACKVAELDLAHLEQECRANPDLAASFRDILARELARMTERVVNLGRGSAMQRTAAFLLDLAVRSSAAGISAGADALDDGWPFPFTQEQISDALGLSAVHVNRTLRSMREMGLIELDGRTLKITNLEDLWCYARHESGFEL